VLQIGATVVLVNDHANPRSVRPVSDPVAGL
jgi:hypothetical protein